MIERGEPWGRAVDRPPDRSVTGGDRALAKALWDAKGLVLAWRPDSDSDFARSLGLRGDHRGDAPSKLALPVDLMNVGGFDAAINAVVVGTAPHRLSWRTMRRRFAVEVDGRRAFAGKAFGVVIANGQFVDGLDLIPRGHPGDGAMEVHVFAVPPSQWRELRRRALLGAHLPHPDIVRRRGTSVDIRSTRRVPCVIDGQQSRSIRHLSIRLSPAHASILVL